MLLTFVRGTTRLIAHVISLRMMLGKCADMLWCIAFLAVWSSVLESFCDNFTKPRPYDSVNSKTV
jgi:hypothetical protein